jgi:hypothetical protein
VSHPALYWNNKFGSEFVPPTVWGSTLKAFLTQNRDFCVGTTSMPTTCNGQSVTYSPYTYPHPLTVDGPRPNSPKIL